MKVGYLALAVLAACGALWYVFVHRSQLWLFNVAGPIAGAERDIIFITVVLCALVVVPVFVMLFSFAWLYREGHPRARRHYLPNWDHHTRAAEIIWWLFPMAIITVLAAIAWQSSHALDPYKPLPGDALNVQVVALDWKWLFIYPDFGIATVNQLEIPVGAPVHFTLTADAPMNTFWIPRLGGQIMAMPGMTTQLYLQADTTGTFDGVSGNISGEGFSGMTFKAIAIHTSDFVAWVDGVRANENPLDKSTYAALAQPSSNVAPIFFSAVADDLFSDIISKYGSTSLPHMMRP